MSLASKTISGVAPPAPISAPSPSSRGGNPDGRYRYTPLPDAMETPVRELTLTDIRATLGGALDDASRALRDQRYDDAAKYVTDATLLTRSLRRFEVQMERARLAAEAE